VYLFSVDPEGGKVVHVNHVPEAFKSKGLDGRAWASKVAEILGGKTGGKEDGAQGVGVNVGRVAEALDAAQNYFDHI